MGKPITDSTRARIIELARQGRSARGIAAELKVAASTVSKVCRNATPLVSFDRAKTKAATDAKREDAKARRARIAEGFLDDVETLRAQLFAARERTYFDPKTRETTTYTSQLTPGELRDLAVSAGVLLDKHLSIAKLDSDDRDLPAVDKWIAWAIGEQD